jgi:hypothetical protein
MSEEVPRIIEVRLFVVVMVNLSSPGLADALAESGNNPMPLAKIVGSEIVSNLESVSYVECAFVSPL